jgi:hypothetical protein
MEVIDSPSDLADTISRERLLQEHAPQSQLYLAVF